MTSALSKLLVLVVGEARTRRLWQTLAIDPRLLEGDANAPSRAVIAQALTMLLFEETSKHVSIGAQAYVRDRVRRGEKIVLDHGAVRTVAASWSCGALPFGEGAITRFLLPLGFSRAGVYVVGSRLTGRAYQHDDYPETICQFFVSEVYPERFGTACQDALERIVRSSREPLETASQRLLERLASGASVGLDQAAALLRNLTACFDRHHEEPTLVDYELLCSESRELAWFATEGNVFNHFTDRVTDLEAVVAEQTRLGRPIKEEIEVSASGRIAQTSFRTATVERLFVDASGSMVSRSVPGSFQELIMRREEAPGRLDLGFDASNAEKLVVTMTEG